MKKVLSLTFGNQHSDWRETAEAVSKEGIELIPFTIKDENWRDIDFSRFDGIELRHCRGWQTRWDEFEPILDRLDTLDIPVFNPTETFRWVRSKADYLKELERKSIEIIPTTVVNSDEHIPLRGFLHEKNNHCVVLKPETGARAKNVIFIEKKTDGMFAITEPDPAGDRTRIMDAEALEDFFIDYRDENAPSSILVQDYLSDAKEVSAVYMNGKFHFVETTKPHGGGFVAHDEYGGGNIYEENPKPELTKFAQRVLDALPERVKHSNYLRIDTISAGGTIRLLEIEAGTPRLFLEEAKGYGQYAEMVKDAIMPEHNQQTDRKSVAIVGGGLAGVSMLSGIVRAAVDDDFTNLDITLYERTRKPGSGLPYRRDLPEAFKLNHELNHMGYVNISRRDADDEDFYLWVQENLAELQPEYPDYDLTDKGTFVPRSLYGQYLEARYYVSSIGRAGHQT